MCSSDLDGRGHRPQHERAGQGDPLGVDAERAKGAQHPDEGVEHRVDGGGRREDPGEDDEGEQVADRLDRKRLLLVITGKGGILRAQLPLWLGQVELKDLVGGISEAHVRHGGSGAFYVTLRLKRR